MSYLSKKDIEEIVRRGDKEKYSHVMICLDHFDYEYFPRYIKRGDDIFSAIEGLKIDDVGNMLSIEEIYNYDMDIEEQLNEVRAYHIESTEKIINIKDKALEFATEKHKGQIRKGADKKEYINHPINVANLVQKYKESHNIDVLVAAAYLHDTLEDTDTTYYELVENFGVEVASLVSELTTNKDMKNGLGKDKYLAYKLKKMTSWALIIKLCDRLDNVSDLYSVDDTFRKKYVNETIFILNYIVDNRELSQPHLNVIKDITSIINIIVKSTYTESSEESKKARELTNNVTKQKNYENS
ncbi:MAG: bifunctional (p)ppGpp synthetase/guanosine-3',5'-bis(diphosphate) 3'-pyrophosphohydrolase [Bacilli bacterium]|nr:bifunctional (p)ppGpp synthetase/guanosine-3',5'-bis(diphosphate) 3'-pyrophosphohydrolase [Bacilli bacterium]